VDLDQDFVVLGNGFRYFGDTQDLGRPIVGVDNRFHAFISCGGAVNRLPSWAQIVWTAQRPVRTPDDRPPPGHTH
jgi:hypothetical protein